MREYVLPLKARAFAAWTVRGFQVGNGKVGSWLPAALPLRSVRRARQPGPGARVETMAERGDTFDPLPEGYTLVELLGEGDRRWLSTGPGWSGLLLGLQFAIDGVPVGISLSRLEPYFVGTAGKILHLQVASRLQSVVDWIVAETAQRLAERRAEILFCRASCPMTAQALRGAGFIGAQPRAVYWWPAGDAPLTGTTSLTYLRADDAVPFDLLAQPPSGSRGLAATATREDGWGHVSSEPESRRSHS
jgi:hypothetical protein